MVTGTNLRRAVGAAITATVLAAGCGTTTQAACACNPDRFHGAEGVDIPPGPGEPSWWIDPIIDNGGPDSPDREQVNIQVTVPADTLFESGSSEISPTAEGALTEVYNSLDGHTIHAATLDCHADSTGGAASNQALSERRADNLSAWITTNWDVPTAKITARGHGEVAPVASNDTPTGRAQNRRCEITLTVEGTT